MERVHADPPDGAHLWGRVVVDPRPFELVVVEPGEQVGEEARRDSQLFAHARWILLVLPFQLDALVAVHRNEGRNVLHESTERSLTLHQHHVAQVTHVLERRPGVRCRTSAKRRRVRLQKRDEGLRGGSQAWANRAECLQVVVEAALVTMLHGREGTSDRPARELNRHQLVGGTKNK